MIEIHGPWSDDAVGGTPWIAVAMTQWKVGRLLDWVRDRAARVIDEGANFELWEPEDVDKRRKVLATARATLLSEQRPAARIRAEATPMSPFSPGDILRYRSSSVREVALWAMRNQTYEGLNQNHDRHRVQLPPVDQLVAAEPVVLTAESGYRTIRLTTLWLPRPGTGPEWEVIANVPFPEGRRGIGSGLTYVEQSRSKRLQRLGSRRKWNIGGRQANATTPKLMRCNRSSILARLGLGCVRPGQVFQGKWLWTWRSRPDDCSTALGLAIQPRYGRKSSRCWMTTRASTRWQAPS